MRTTPAGQVWVKAVDFIYADVQVPAEYHNFTFEAYTPGDEKAIFEVTGRNHETREFLVRQLNFDWDVACGLDG